MERIENLLTKNDTGERATSKIITTFKEDFNCKIGDILEIIIEYLGEQYRSIILERFSKLTFIITLKPESIKEYIKLSIESEEKRLKKMGADESELNRYKEQYDALVVYYDYYMRKRIPLNKFQFGYNSICPFEDDELFEYENCFRFLSHKNTVCPYIFYDLFLLDDEVIVHEILHGISSEILALIEENNSPASVVIKNGLEVWNYGFGKNDSVEEIFNEILIQKMASEITVMMHDRGISITNNMNISYFGSLYDSGFPLVKRFFDSYRSTIIEAMITINKNALVNRVEKGNYENYVGTVNLNYVPEYTNDPLYGINEAVSRMERFSGISRGPRVIKPHIKKSI